MSVTIRQSCTTFRHRLYDKTRLNIFASPVLETCVQIYVLLMILLSAGILNEGSVVKHR